MLVPDFENVVRKLEQQVTLRGQSYDSKKHENLQQVKDLLSLSFLKISTDPSLSA